LCKAQTKAVGRPSRGATTEFGLRPKRGKACCLIYGFVNRGSGGATKRQIVLRFGKTSKLGYSSWSRDEERPPVKHVFRSQAGRAEDYPAAGAEACSFLRPCGAGG